MKFQFEKCKERGKIVKMGKDPELVRKELKESSHDLDSAQKSLSKEDYKWTIVQCYYSMFHAFRALLFSRGYREKSHICLKFAIETLFVDEGILNRDLLDNFDFAMRSRERADYSYTYNLNLAEDLLDSSRELLDEVENLVSQ